MKQDIWRAAFLAAFLGLLYLLFGIRQQLSDIAFSESLIEDYATKACFSFDACRYQQ